MTTERRSFPIGLTIATGIAFLILIGLGTWQVQRLKWKEGVLAHIAALQTAPARPLATVLGVAAVRPADADFTRVTASCPGLAKAPFLELFSVRDGQPGARLISACVLEGAPYGSVLVDRGFVADGAAARPAIDPADRTPLQVTGVLRVPEHGNLFSPANQPPHWYIRDIPAMAAQLGAARPAPLTLMAETATNPEVADLKPAPIPADIPNNHLQYAITWYGLAAALLGVYAAVLSRRRKS